MDPIHKLREWCGTEPKKTGADKEKKTKRPEMQAAKAIAVTLAAVLGCIMISGCKNSKYIGGGDCSANPFEQCGNIAGNGNTDWIKIR